MFPFRNNFGDPVGPHRVWHPTGAYPGLAMSRSLGDYVAHQYGVIADPEIIEYQIKPEDKVIVIASDGIWEFLSNQQVIDILSIGIEDNNYKKAVDTLIQYATSQWQINDN